MTHRTRNFLIGSAAVVAIGLGTGLVAYYNGNLPLRRQADLQLTYLPADAAAVGYADVRTIMDSEFRQKLKQVLPTGEEAQKLRDEIGVDIEKDIDTLTAAYMGGGNSAFEGAVVIVRGRFNDAQIETQAVQHGATAEEYRGKRILTMTEGHDAMAEGTTRRHASAAVAFLEPGVLALGELNGIKKAVDAGLDGADITKNAQLMGVIDDLRGTGNAWFVGRLDAMSGDRSIPEQLKEHLPPVDLFAVSAQVNGGLSGALRADARDDKAAEQLRDVVRGALAAGQLMAGKNPQMDAMLSSIQITGTGKTVGLTFRLPSEILDVLNGIAAAQGLAQDGRRK